MVTAAQPAAVVCTDESHERVKWTRAWDELVAIGVMDDGEGGGLEMRNCGHCGSTLCKPMVKAAPPTDHVVDVVMDEDDALLAGQTIRGMVRDHQRFPIPAGTRELLARIGWAMTSAARASRANRGAK